ncbi:aquaporin Z [Trinickia diaoshuihuensis]|uniref:aquaporin Z n=1 Tax=Trinickia diaoshuihuensis TaxID=2292265 RepID=UPI000E2363CF|nr:aquaporin Z [Trinickia diaoshuihuensis]
MRALQRYVAELVGTFWLVLCGCGSALIAANFHASADSGGIGLVGVSLAFGLAVATMIYAIGPVSGGHMNPAVTIGLTVAGRFETKHVVPYVAAQVIGATAAAFVLKFIVSGAPGFDAAASGFASNGFGEHSPGHYTMQAAFLCEAVMTAFFVFVVLGATDKRAPAGFAGLVIGLCLTLIHLVTIPVTGTSVNAARSTGPALVAGGAALDQLWLFWLAPVVGAVVAAVIYPLIVSESDTTPRARSAALGSDEQGVAARGD